MKLRIFPLFQKTDFSKLKEFADNNFKFDGNGITFSKQEENTVGKGEIARKEQFLLFPRCLKRRVQQTRKTRTCLGKG